LVFSSRRGKTTATHAKSRGVDGKKVAVSADFAALVGKNSQNLRSFEQVVRDSVPFWPVF
jgi:hypothetical protein